MSFMRVLMGLGLVLASAASASPASAQTRANTTWRMHDADVVSLTSSFRRDDHGGHVRLEVAKVTLPGPLTGAVNHGQAGTARQIYDGDPVAAALVATPAGAAVIAWDPTSVVVHVARLDVPATDASALKTVRLDRSLGTEARPFVAIGCLVGDSVGVLWNEVGPGTGGAARSFYARVGLDGTVAEAAHEVQVPWSLAAIAQTPDGFALAVRYDGQGPDQTRLCLVHLTATLTPTEHPWWATRPAMVGDVQLVRAGDVVRIVYATPAGVVVSAHRATGQWGQDGPASARLAGPGSFAAGVRANGEPAIVTP
jgi:hypothetical protein